MNIKPENVKVTEELDLNFEPLWDYLLIKPVKKDKTKGGIVLPDGSRLDDLSTGLVVKAGKGAYRESGAFIENPIKVGDTIYMMGHVKPFVVPLNGETYCCVSGRDVVAVTKYKAEPKDYEA